MAVILASKSPRRQELLRLLDVEFTIQTADIDEAMDNSKPPEDEVARVSAAKAAAIAKTAQAEDIVISADTIVVSQGEILGKPTDEADAARMLRMLSGGWHEVMTAVTVCRAEESVTRVSRTRLRFKALSEEEIAAYIATGEPMDKAGSYGIQGKASLFAEELHGDYFGVMGLPVCLLAQMLRGFGMNILGKGETV